ncbi:hypothetical protein ACWDZ8_23250 [Streptomyces sp. NPDC003233]
MTSDEQAELENWRDALLEDLHSSDISLAVRALLRLTYEDPDRRWMEGVILECLSPKADPQIRALAVTCLGHLGRLHRAVSPEVTQRLESLLDDPVLGGQAEDALGDIAYFASNGTDSSFKD